MDLETGIRSRRSIRKFSDRAVPEETIREILDAARWSPSWANTQPWNIYVITGEPLAKIKAAYGDKVAAKEERFYEIARPHPEWPPELAARTKQLMGARAPSSAAGPGNATFFGAPCLSLFAIDERLQPEYACFDTGLLVQTVCLAARGKGLGTCIMAMAVGYPDVLHRIVPAAEGKRFVVGVAFGFADEAALVNRFERTRAPLNEIVSWVK